MGVQSMPMLSEYIQEALEKYTDKVCVGLFKILTQKGFEVDYDGFPEDPEGYEETGYYKMTFRPSGCRNRVVYMLIKPAVAGWKFVVTLRHPQKPASEETEYYFIVGDERPFEMAEIVFESIEKRNYL